MFNKFVNCCLYRVVVKFIRLVVQLTRENCSFNNCMIFYYFLFFFKDIFKKLSALDLMTKSLKTASVYFHILQ